MANNEVRDRFTSLGRVVEADRRQDVCKAPLAGLWRWDRIERVRHRRE